MSFAEAFKGAWVEVSSLKTGREKAARVLRISHIFLSEIAGLLTLAPYGYRALQTYRSIHDFASHSTNNHTGVSIVKDVRYGSKARNVMDIYLPQAAASRATALRAKADGAQSPLEEPVPVAIFCHGGVWSAGDKWQYAPMAARLAQAGVLTCVLHYSLYPEAHAAEMVDELSAALTWTFDNVDSFGGDVGQVSLLGHSAGAQLCSMALLHRAWGRRTSASGGANAQPRDSRQLARFVGMAGVYDISKHYEYEDARHVAELSTMKRAIGGFSKFAEQSPAIILADALRRAGRGRQWDTPYTEGSFYRSFELRGQAIAHRLGIERPGLFLGTDTDQHCGLSPAEISPASAPLRPPLLETGIAKVEQGSDSSAAAAAPSSGLGQRLVEESTSDGSIVTGFAVEDAAALPPHIFMSGCNDVIVPWYESAEMDWRLRACGAKSKFLIYERVGHKDFVTSWKVHSQLSSDCKGETGDLPDFACDLVKILLNRVEVNYDGRNM